MKSRAKLNKKHFVGKFFKLCTRRVKSYNIKKYQTLALKATDKRKVMCRHRQYVTTTVP